MNSEKIALFIFSIIVFASCKTKFDDPKYSSGEADFSRYVALGGSSTAGYSDNALYLEGQQNSVAAILASRFALAGGGEFKQPLVNAGNGLGNKYILNYGSTCGSNVYYLTSLASDQSNLNWIGNKGPYNNLGVPGAKSFNLNDQDFGRRNGNLYYYRFATDTGISLKSSTILGDAGKVRDDVGIGPTFFSMWVGLNDYLGYALAGGESDSVTPIDIFNSAIDTVLIGLTSYSGKGVVANLPNIESLPFFNTVPYNGLELTQAQADLLNSLTLDTFNFVAGANPFIVKNHLQDPQQIRKITSNELILSSALDSIKCKGWGTPQNPIPYEYILDANELLNIHNAATAYNSKLQSAALSKSLAFVDMNGFFHTLVSGVVYSGVNYNSQYFNGGAYSLDGIHLNARGYAMVANEFIRVINTKYKSTVPETDVNHYPGIRFP